MRPWLLSLAASVFVCTASIVAHAATPQDGIVGVWLTERQDSKIEITKSGADYAGKIIWLEQPERDGKPLHDAKNPEAALRDRPILNLEILSGFVFEGNGTWSHGTIYSPQTGKRFSAELSLPRQDRLDVKVKDGIFFKHVAWTRVSP